MRKKIFKKVLDLHDEIPMKRYEPLRSCPAAKEQEEGLTLPVRLAWLHRDAITLNPNDLTELKFGLKKLISDSEGLLEIVRSELTTQRKRGGGRVHLAGEATAPGPSDLGCSCNLRPSGHRHYNANSK